MKKDRDLPVGMYRSHGAFYLVRRNKWTRLGDNLSDALLRYARIVNPTAGGMPQLLDEFLLDCKTRKKPVAASTLRAYTLAAKILKEELQEFDPADLLPTHVARLLDHHAKTPNMANLLRKVLKGAMNRAVRHGLSRSNPVISIPAFEEDKRDRYVKDAEFDRVAACATPIARATMKLQYLTGQRIGDVIAIKHSDISEAGIEFQQGKTDKKLIVGMTPELQAAINEAKKLRVVRGSYLICKANGRPYSYWGMYAAITLAAQKAGVKDYRPNDLRAKSGTDAEEQGVDPTKLLGHDSPKTTKTYLRNRKAKVVQGPKYGAK